jgi:TonB-dependent starch-binding outer membrane protein SusC
LVILIPHLPLAKGLEFKVNLGADIFSVSENRFVPNFLKRGESTNGVAVLARVNGRSWLAEYTMNYNKTIGNNQLNFLIGNTYQGFLAKGFSCLLLIFKIIEQVIIQ